MSCFLETRLRALLGMANVSISTGQVSLECFSHPAFLHGHSVPVQNVNNLSSYQNPFPTALLNTCKVGNALKGLSKSGLRPGMGDDRHTSMLRDGGESTALAVLPPHFSSWRPKLTHQEHASFL